jgi:hypothetical protein
MPPLPPINKTLKLTLFYDDNGADGPVCRAANILHLTYGTTSSPGIPNLINVANGAATWWTSHFKPSVATKWRLTKASALWLDGSGQQGDSTFAAVPGAATGVTLPPQSSVAISWLGAPAVRGGRPRTYLPGIPQSAASTGASFVNTAYANTLKAAAVAAIADMTPFVIGADNAALCTVSYFNKTLNPTPPHLRPTPVVYLYVGAKVHTRLDSQRRRSGKESNYPFS